MDRRYNDNDDRAFEIKSLTEKEKDSKDDLLRKEISDFSNLQPEVVAQLIRSWINSGE